MVHVQTGKRANGQHMDEYGRRLLMLLCIYISVCAQQNAVQQNTRIMWLSNIRTQYRNSFGRTTNDFFIYFRLLMSNLYPTFATNVDVFNPI